MSIVLQFFGDLFLTALTTLPWTNGAKPDRRAIEKGRVYSGIRAVEGRVLNIGTEWSTGICEVTPRHLRFVPRMGIVGTRDIRVESVRLADLGVREGVDLDPRPSTALRVTTHAGDLYWQIPVRVFDKVLSQLEVQVTP
jgi:hypothetical protein